MACMSRLLSFVAGAVSVGIVVGVLAIAGAFDGGDTIVRAETAPPATTSPATATNVSDIYSRASAGVVFVRLDSEGRPEREVRAHANHVAAT